jgi:hypothetical protein
MCRLIAILLVPFFAVGNSLAHSHGSAAHPSSSHGRAHIHVGSDPQHSHGHASHGHSHHGHRHKHPNHRHGDAVGQNCKSDDSNPAPIELPFEHESDAVYVAAADFMVTASAQFSIEVGLCAAVETVEHYLSTIRSRTRLDRPPLAVISELPLYLLHAALRI